MNLSKQLYQLQETDLEIESKERTIAQLTGQLGESEALVSARAALDAERQHLEDLTRQQHDLEREIDDLSTKIAAAEAKLYGGKVASPKELSSLQNDAGALKDRRGQQEDRALVLMEQVEAATASVATLSRQLKTLEAEGRKQRKKLAADIKTLKTALSGLKEKRQLLSAEIDAQIVEAYCELKSQKGIAVVRVEQGICRGCQISLAASELQRIRGNSLVRCSSCGRILFLA